MGGENIHAYVAYVWIKYPWQDTLKISNIGCTGWLKNWGGIEIFTRALLEF